jgi:hypothetical protein
MLINIKLKKINKKSVTEIYIFLSNKDIINLCVGKFYLIFEQF